MSSTTSIECSIKFDSAEAAKEQLKIFQNIPDDKHDCLGTWIDSFEFGEAVCEDQDKYICLFVQVRGEPESHKIMTYFWEWIEQSEHVEDMNIRIENLENGSYGVLQAVEPRFFTEKWIPREDVFEVIRRNSDDVGTVYEILNKMLE